ncbi:DUF397 domain-containing protein [Yinghuangia sp. YIM S10712]|uniref:DUF397 domain-containing protein n=1 Tax=Yinghuangia sp. YIM S10712 TaxID=3436930 RepID=UPI003F532107
MSDQLGWRKSSHSDEEGGACVEVAASQGALHVRDSKHKAGPKLAVTQGAWEALVRATAS